MPSTGTGSIAFSGGQLTLHGGVTASAGRARQAIATEGGKVYRLRVNCTTAWGSGAGFLLGSTAGGVNTYPQTSLSLSGDNDIYFVALSATTWVELYNINNNDKLCESVSVVQVSTFPWDVTTGSRQGSVTFTTGPTLPSATETIVEFAAGNTRSRAAIVWATDGAIRLQVYYNTAAQADINLGTVGTNKRTRCAFNFKTDMVRAAVNGVAAQADISAQVPGLSHLRLGYGFSGAAFSGTVQRFAMGLSTLQDRNGSWIVANSALNNFLVGIGDSVMDAAGASTVAQGQFPATRNYFTPPIGGANTAIGGQKTDQIAGRWNALPLLITVTGNQIPATTDPVTITATNEVPGVPGTFMHPITFQGPQAFAGYLLIGGQKVVGVLTRIETDAVTHADYYTFTRKTAGAAIMCPPGTQFVFQTGADLRVGIPIINGGRNNVGYGHDAIVAHVDAIVRMVPHGRYIVTSLLSGFGDSPASIATINQVNATFASRYGLHYADQLTALLASPDPTPGGYRDGDLADIAAGIVPGTLRLDGVHPNSAGNCAASGRSDGIGGNEIMAAVNEATIIALGYDQIVP